MTCAFTLSMGGGWVETIKPFILKVLQVLQCLEVCFNKIELTFVADHSPAKPPH